MSNNTIVVHDTEYVMNKSYREGALDFRSSIPWSCNPHRDGTQSNQDWDYGHVNESAGEHIRFGIDLVVAPLKGSRFELDTSVPRIDGGDVDPVWLRDELRRLAQASGRAAPAPGPKGP